MLALDERASKESLLLRLVQFPVLGAFAEQLWKASMSFVTCLNSLLLTGQIFVEFYIVDFYWNLLIKLKSG
jgi:hypothetical protein